MADPPTAPGSSAKAVLFGLGADIGGTLVFSIVIGIGYGIYVVGTGKTDTEIEQAFSDLPSHTWLSVIGLLVGVGFSVLGGYVCARISRRSDYQLGFVLGTLSAISGLLLSDPSHSPSYMVGLTVLTLAAVLLGTKLGKPDKLVEVQNR
ncbi:MAG: hypothetical protein ACT4NL_13800 [Pseudomarimonas sp.]